MPAHDRTLSPRTHARIIVDIIDGGVIAWFTEGQHNVFDTLWSKVTFPVDMSGGSHLFLALSLAQAALSQPPGLRRFGLRRAIGHLVASLLTGRDA